MTNDEVIDFLSNLSVLEISKLVKALEEKWGVTAAAPVAVAAAPAAAATSGDAGAPDLREQLSCGSGALWERRARRELFSLA